MSAPAMVGRREFLKTGAAVGGGLLVSWHMPLSSAAAGKAGAAENQVALNAFVRIGTDESVTVISSHSEMGQGVYTSLPMLLNEELEADWSKIRVEAAPVDKVYNHPIFGMQMTGGSTTSPAEWERYRKMGALARTMLVSAAAQQWKVDVRVARWTRAWCFIAPPESVQPTAHSQPRPRSSRPDGSEVERREELHLDRQADAAAGHAIQNEWKRPVWPGRQFAGNAYRGRGAAASIRRKSGEG